MIMWNLTLRDIVANHPLYLVAVALILMALLLFWQWISKAPVVENATFPEWVPSLIVSLEALSAIVAIALLIIGLRDIVANHQFSSVVVALMCIFFWWRISDFPDDPWWANSLIRALETLSMIVAVALLIAVITTLTF